MQLFVEGTIWYLLPALIVSYSSTILNVVQTADHVSQQDIIYSRPVSMAIYAPIHVSSVTQVLAVL